jgi:hypothetical protein
MRKVETFMRHLTALRNSVRNEEKIIRAFNACNSDNYIVDLGSNELHSVIIELLEVAVGDTSNWIKYFVFECDFGENLNSDSVQKDGVHIPFRTFEDVWNCIKDV